MSTDEHAESRKQLGQKLRKARTAAKLTQQQVADAADVHVNFYARVERGVENPSFEKLQGMMKALGVKSLDLY
jgi:transcriptional regulator with XRE-family HTH domain